MPFENAGKEKDVGSAHLFAELLGAEVAEEDDVRTVAIGDKLAAVFEFFASSSDSKLHIRPADRLLQDHDRALVGAQGSGKQDPQLIIAPGPLRGKEVAAVDSVMHGASFDAHAVAQHLRHVLRVADDGLGFADIARESGTGLAVVEFAARDNVSHQRGAQAKIAAKVQKGGIERSFAGKEVDVGNIAHAGGRGSARCYRVDAIAGSWCWPARRCADRAALRSATLRETSARQAGLRLL